VQNLKSLRHLFRFRSHYTAGSGRDGIPGAGQQEVIYQKFLHQPSEKGMEVLQLLFWKLDRTVDVALYFL
jgi:hypothetical protein